MASKRTVFPAADEIELYDAIRERNQSRRGAGPNLRRRRIPRALDLAAFHPGYLSPPFGAGRSPTHQSLQFYRIRPLASGRSGPPRRPPIRRNFFAQMTRNPEPGPLEDELGGGASYPESTGQSDRTGRDTGAGGLRGGRARNPRIRRRAPWCSRPAEAAALPARPRTNIPAGPPP
jgi:hypothetical protein